MDNPALHGAQSRAKERHFKPSANLLFADDRAAVQFVRDGKSNFAGLRGVGNFIIGKELARSMAGPEVDLDFEPERVETIALNGIKDTDERLAAWQTGIGHINDVDGSIVLQGSLFATGGQFLEVDGEQLMIVIGGHIAGGTIFILRPCGQGSEQGDCG